MSAPGADSSGELAAAGETAAEDAVIAVSEAVICQDDANMDEKEASVNKMSVFKKKEKTSFGKVFHDVVATSHIRCAREIK